MVAVRSSCSFCRSMQPDFRTLVGGTIGHRLYRWFKGRIKDGLLLRNSCPYTTYPTFSFPPMEDHTSPLTNSSLHRTDTRTHPHSFPMPRVSETRSVPILDASSSCFTFLVLIRFALPPALQTAGLHLVPRMFSSLESAAAPHPLRSIGPPFRFPFLHRTILHLFLSLVQRCGSLP